MITAKVQIVPVGTSWRVDVWTAANASEALLIKPSRRASHTYYADSIGELLEIVGNASANKWSI